MDEYIWCDILFIMPELPEVETIRLGLEKYLVGHKIQDVEVRLGKILQGDTKDILGAKITKVERFGKGLVIRLNNGYCLAIHIKLTGQLIYQDKKHSNSKVKIIRNSYGTLPHKATHVIFYLDQDAKLFYNDFRKFGWIKILPYDQLQKVVFFKELGPEFGKEINVLAFGKLLSQSKMPIKSLLMDQKKISGLGNIYVNDGLYDAKIYPAKKAVELTDMEKKTLYQSLKKVLEKGIESGGASELSYVNALGQEGEYQKHFLAYGQEGKVCKRCKTTIKKIMLGGRGTYFCPVCQPSHK